MTEPLRSTHDESIEGRPAAENVAARLGWVGAHLEEMGAAAVILIDAAPWPRSSGATAWKRTARSAASSVGWRVKSVRQDMTDADLLTWADARGDQLAVLFFRPRADMASIASCLPELSSG